MKIGRIRYTTAIILLMVLFVGCESILHEEDSSIGKIESYSDLLTATGGVYGTLAAAVGEKSFYCANVKGDDITWGFAKYDSSFTSYQNKAEESNFDEVTDNTVVWKTLYSTIVSANNILVQYPSPSECDRETQKVLGEIYLIRAYCHFRLTRNYGQIPLIDNIDVSYYTQKSSYSEIYSFIESDLKTAMDLLPENNSLAREPSITPHRGTAKALLAEVYLSWAGYPANDAAKYELAASEAGGVIDSAAYFGFALMDDFASLWDNAHLYNSESVFTLYIPNSPNAYNISSDYVTYYDFCDNVAPYFGHYYASGHNFLTPSRDMNITTFFLPSENKFYNTYPHQYRKEVTFYTTLYFKSDENPSYYMDEIYKDNRTGYRKFYYDPTLDEYTYYVGSTKGLDSLYLGIPRVYLFRYAHTVLTYAEAMARSGQLNDKAYECVNQIRRRANQLNLYSPSVYDLQPGLSAEAFADSVVQERAWELCGEPEGRWYDLVRLERVEDLSTLRNPEEGGPPFGVYNKSVYFSEIPATDIVLNPNLTSK